MRSNDQRELSTLGLYVKEGCRQELKRSCFAGGARSDRRADCIDRARISHVDLRQLSLVRNNWPRHPWRPPGAATSPLDSAIRELPRV